jgi:hypothetical protein
MAIGAMTIWAVTMQSDMKIGLAAGNPCESFSPASGSMAALAK